MPGALGPRWEEAWTCPQHPNNSVGATKPGHEAQFKNYNSRLIRKKSVEFQLQQCKQLHLNVILSQAAGAGPTLPEAPRKSRAALEAGVAPSLHRVPRTQHKAGAP